MKLRTSIEQAKSPLEFNHWDGIVTMGSCFSENIGALLAASKFNVLTNPFGTIYNGHSIRDLIVRAVNNSEFNENELIFNPVNELYAHPLLHTSFSSMDRTEVIENGNKALRKTRTSLSNGKVLIITLGSSFVYQLKPGLKTVANCHKLPASNFERKLIDLQSQVDAIEQMKRELYAINSNLNVIFTVSPVRHIKDGLEENALSKSILRLVCHEVCQNRGYYFPSYEMVIDDLRDYRFYRSDLIHPNDQAVEYIWEIFKDTYFSEETKQLITQIDKINRSLEHRPFNPGSNAYKAHLKGVRSQIDMLCEKYVFLKGAWNN